MSPANNLPKKRWSILTERVLSDDPREQAKGVARLANRNLSVAKRSVMVGGFPEGKLNPPLIKENKNNRQHVVAGYNKEKKKNLEGLILYARQYT